MAKPFRVTLSKRQLLERSQRISNYYADSFGKPRMQNELLAALPPKRVIRRPVDGKPVGPSEHQEQATVISWWGRVCHGYEFPYFALFAIPNGGPRDVITGSRLKAEGVRRGTPDLCLAVPRGAMHGLYIEMKAQHGARESDEQQEFYKYLTTAGYRSEFCYGADAAIALIKEYLA